MLLGPGVEVVVDVDDQSRFGSPLTHRPEGTAQLAFAPFAAHLRDHGPAELGRRAKELLDRSRLTAAFAEVTRPASSGWEVVAEARFPDRELARYHRLLLSDDRGALEIPVPRGDWSALRDLLAAPTPHDELTELLAARGILVAPQPCTSIEADITFVGHNTVVVRSGSTALVLDPFLRPSGPQWPDDYQPLTVDEIGHVDAICLTHSHPDHFDPASLLRFSRETPVLVPELERETILAVNLLHRLHELGFDDVRPLGWWQSARVGSLEITALPFYGEQPTDGEVLHPDIRNAGNTYAVSTREWSAAFLADSGRDHLGDVRDVGDRWRRERGPVDVVFGGYRGWTTYPGTLVGSSVARYLLFVPPAQWGVRQRLMNDVDGLLDTAEHFGAHWVVPYADGGAPWYWSIGLGPRLDGSGIENEAFDPFPERVVAAAARRVVAPDGRQVASPATVLLLRPGDSVRGLPLTAELVRTPGHIWPW